MMKRLLVSGISAAAAFSLVAPSFALFIDGESTRMSRRAINVRARAMNSFEMKSHRRMRRDPARDDISRRMLQRSEARRFRRLNRSPKKGHDRYRILNRSQLKINTRWLRRQDQSYLPSLLVQTGGMDYSFDRPSRRSIVETALAIRSQ